MLNPAGTTWVAARWRARPIGEGRSESPHANTSTSGGGSGRLPPPGGGSGRPTSFKHRHFWPGFGPDPGCNLISIFILTLSTAGVRDVESGGSGMGGGEMAGETDWEGEVRVPPRQRLRFRQDLGKGAPPGGTGANGGLHLAVHWRG